jgi:hypothetical protein
MARIFHAFRARPIERATQAFILFTPRSPASWRHLLGLSGLRGEMAPAEKTVAH